MIRACSYGMATLVPRVTQQAVIQFLRAHVVPAYERAGHRIQALLTDGAPSGRHALSRPVRSSASATDARAHAWTNGFLERLQGTILTELWRIAFRRTYYRSIAQLEHDLQGYLRFYNRERPHQGYRLQGRTQAAVFLARKAS